jgi:hypothetical protein
VTGREPCRVPDRWFVVHRRSCLTSAPAGLTGHPACGHHVLGLTVLAMPHTQYCRLHTVTVTKR